MRDNSKGNGLWTEEEVGGLCGGEFKVGGRKETNQGKLVGRGSQAVNQPG